VARWEDAQNAGSITRRYRLPARAPNGTGTGIDV
jgi:hypothetical protein